MQILNDKNVKIHAIIIVSILLALILVNQITVMLMVNGYKETMFAHDNAVAGYLSRNGIDYHQIILAFTFQKTDKDEEAGSVLLSASGYKQSIKNSLLPETERLHQKYSLTALVFSVVFSIILFAVFCSFELKCDKKLKNAGEKIRRFMDGDTAIRLDDSKEDYFSRFFADVNTMATSLNAHIEKEKHSREFLVDTISDISHQLKTPLTALQMYNEIIIDEKTGNEVVENFTFKSKRELSRMESLIQNLLKLAKLDAGAIDPEKKLYRLKDFLEKCLCAFITRAEMEGKSINLQCDNSTSLFFDEIWLGEAVCNIIKNALDHTVAGDQIEITCAETVLSTEIIVSDNGTGIYQEDIHYIFKRFYRSRYSKNRQGVGIGLALAKAIVEQHGGTITVQSELGRGSAFHFIFPKLSNL